jgi:hypothetical protein
VVGTLLLVHGQIGLILAQIVLIRINMNKIWDEIRFWLLLPILIVIGLWDTRKRDQEIKRWRKNNERKIS